MNLPKCKILYVLVSNKDSLYYEQALVSITSLKLHNPNAFVTLITDSITYETFTGFREGIKKIVNELKVIELPESMSSKKKSRYLKTKTRNLVDGDFLFLDTDTIVTDSLESIKSFDCEIGAVIDVHNLYTYTDNIQCKWAKQIGFHPLKNNLNFNSGVMFVKDTENTRKFYNRWHELWNYSVTKGIYTDQNALTEADFEFGYFIKELPGEWNCMIKYGINYLAKAKILHIWGSAVCDSENIHPLGRKNFYLNIKNNEKIDKEAMYIIKNAKETFSPRAEIAYENTVLENVLNSPLFLFCKKHKKVLSILNSFIIFSRKMRDFIFFWRRRQ